MQRHELEHILRACAGITGKTQFIVVGSQAVLGQFPDAPEELLVSRDADVFCPDDPEASDLIDGTIGEMSPFDQAFKYYAHGVAEETALLPCGWRDRLVPLHTPQTGGATGLCLEAHDLAVSKLIAGRDKDLAFVQAMLRHRMVTESLLRDRLAATDIPPDRRTVNEGRITRLVRESIP